MDLGPTTLSGQFILDDIDSKPMAHRLANLNYVCMFDVWAHTLDKLKRAFTCTLLAWWIYSFWFQLNTFYCCYVIESWFSVFDTMLRALIGFDLCSTVSFDVEQLMLRMPLFEHISEGCSLGVIQHLT